jgi:hypothetical protein
MHIYSSYYFYFPVKHKNKKLGPLFSRKPPKECDVVNPPLDLLPEELAIRVVQRDLAAHPYRFVQLGISRTATAAS